MCMFPVEMRLAMRITCMRRTRPCHIRCRGAITYFQLASVEGQPTQANSDVVYFGCRAEMCTVTDVRACCTAVYPSLASMSVLPHQQVHHFAHQAHNRAIQLSISLYRDVYKGVTTMKVDEGLRQCADG